MSPPSTSMKSLAGSTYAHSPSPSTSPTRRRSTTPSSCKRSACSVTATRRRIATTRQAGRRSRSGSQPDQDRARESRQVPPRLGCAGPRLRAGRPGGRVVPRGARGIASDGLSRDRGRGHRPESAGRSSHRCPARASAGSCRRADRQPALCRRRVDPIRRSRTHRHAHAEVGMDPTAASPAPQCAAATSERAAYE